MQNTPQSGTFALVTLGCKVNQYESHALREAWLARGLEEAATPDGAGVVCVNTCAITANAVADARAVIRRIHRANPGAGIIVTGCAAQVLGEEFWSMEGVVLVVPQADKATLLRIPECAFSGFCEPGAYRAQTAPPETAAFPPFSIADYDRSRAILKVQDGCSHRCTYCIVPFTRGPSRSRPQEETLAEARRLLDAGFRELVVNGINLAQYGRDLAPAHDFWDLVAFLDTALAPEWKGRARLRLSSLEPGQLTAKALDVLGNSALVAPHLHLSLQSASRDVLRRMGRGHYDPGVIAGFCEQLATVFPLFGLGADILTGFPGETDEQAAENLALCESLPFSYAHVFPYSRRPGTPAATWPEQVPTPVKKERAARLRGMFDRKREAFLNRCLALPHVNVACEPTAAQQDGNGGINEFYSDCRFTTALQDAPHKSIRKAKPVSVEDGVLVVEAL